MSVRFTVSLCLIRYTYSFGTVVNKNLNMQIGEERKKAYTPLRKDVSSTWGRLDTGGSTRPAPWAAEWVEATCNEGARTAMQTREGAHTGGRAGVDNTYSQYVKPRAVSHRRAHRPQHPEVCSGDRPPTSLGARGGSPADKKPLRNWALR